MKTFERLKEMKALERYIESQIKHLERLESQALKVNAALPQADKIGGGNQKKRDDLYIELIAMKDDIDKHTKLAIEKKREFLNQIALVEDIESRLLLQLVYVEQLTIWQICDRLEISKTAYYTKLRRAEKLLD